MLSIYSKSVRAYALADFFVQEYENLPIMELLRFDDRLQSAFEDLIAVHLNGSQNEKQPMRIAQQ